MHCYLREQALLSTWASKQALLSICASKRYFLPELSEQALLSICASKQALPSTWAERESAPFYLGEQASKRSLLPLPARASMYFYLSWASKRYILPARASATFYLLDSHSFLSGQECNVHRNNNLSRNLHFQNHYCTALTSHGTRSRWWYGYESCCQVWSVGDECCHDDLML